MTKQNSVAELTSMVEELESVLCYLEDKLNKKKFKSSRKEQVMDILKERNLISVTDIGKRVGITNRNVSSILCYLRDDLEKQGNKQSIVKIGRGVGRLKLIDND